MHARTHARMHLWKAFAHATPAWLAVMAMVVTLTLAGITPAAAQPRLDNLRFKENRAVTYQCDGGRRLAVRYLNGDSNQLALMRIDDKPMVFVNVMSGSGARYVGGRYEWWTKGEDGNLRDLMGAQDAPPVFANCHAVR
ncbi:MliC family protein [Cupriavidus plantarum]|uniref:MliC family protein n=1 Tax=Cupriavidus plantarum TaxID=942865 RepID=UPI000E382270|nr:MliC family protein [Cupriavidus plantarum]NYH99630.1 membrane-bound inhibitor of C-type lysozyme [Cupriavidus plantarum]REF02426.1 membrane-bound inhibitor of C-type lysozyme [Cupriavidus plantarum]RLK44716.1 membrane-bound inhibitor of C-type lysozyme [Cupriavidus plantarum]